MKVLLNCYVGGVLGLGLEGGLVVDGFVFMLELFFVNFVFRVLKNCLVRVLIMLLIICWLVLVRILESFVLFLYLILVFFLDFGIMFSFIFVVVLLILFFWFSIKVKFLGFFLFLMERLFLNDFWMGLILILEVVMNWFGVVFFRCLIFGVILVSVLVCNNFF